MSASIDEIVPEVLRLLAKRAGLAVESFGAAAISYAIRKRIPASGAASEKDYMRRLAAGPSEFQELLEELVVPETWFFRDLLAYGTFSRRLGDTRVRPEGALRVLSVGCSTGEEVYSLAMTLREAGFTPPQFSILGTDVSRRSLDSARKGAFMSRSFRERDGAIGALCARWCERAGDSWRVRDELCAGVEFVQGNLSQPDFLADVPPFHAIFCRNVLIYFHAEARDIAVRRLQSLLRPDGLLYAAPAEARIFSEAGFGSLGSECPFAFRHPDEPRNRPGGAPSLREAARPSTLDALIPHLSSLIPHPISPPSRPVDSGPPSAMAADNKIACDFDRESVLDAAAQAADEGRLDEADALCELALKRDPVSAGAHYLRGVVRQAQGALDEAQRGLERALYLNPKHYQALVHMMLLAEQRGDRRAADNYRRRAEQATPQEAP